VAADGPDFEFTTAEKVVGPFVVAGLVYVLFSSFWRSRDPYWRFDGKGISEYGRRYKVLWDQVDSWAVRPYLGGTAIMFYRTTGSWWNLDLKNFGDPQQAIAAVQERLGPPTVRKGRRVR
jgi:hypothetical protein